jgi:hypothetical protein
MDNFKFDEYGQILGLDVDIHYPPQRQPWLVPWVSADVLENSTERHRMALFIEKAMLSISREIKLKKFFRG